MKSRTFVGLAVVLASAALPAAPAAIHQPWPMHHVCRDFLSANSLSAADVDGDGFDDYSVIDERRGLMTVIFHPAKGGDVRQEWPRMILGETGNPEYACLGDLSKWTTHFLDPDTPSGHGFVFADINGDGRLDLVGALIHNPLK